MKAKILAYYGYNYTDKKTGEVKTGRSIDVMQSLEFKQDDNRGNFAYGYTCKSNIRVPEKYSHYDMLEFVGKDCELTFGQAPGSKYESLVEIEII